MTEAQQRAADPAASAWVSASAGTGKTKVLIDRVLRILLSGTDPGRILCLTFTRAAAAEMAIRITHVLGRWATNEQESLQTSLHELLQREATADELARARLLFAHVLETPGRMKILTIHAFCQSLLRRFPLEAGIAPHFSVADDRTKSELLNEAQNRLLRHSQHGGATGADEQLAAAFAAITAQIGEDSFSTLMADFTNSRAKLGDYTEEKMAAAVAAMVGVREGESGQALCDAAAAEGAFARDSLVAAVAALEEGSKTDVARAALIADWLAGDDTVRADKLEAYCRAFLKKDGDPLVKLATKKVCEAAPDVADTLAQEQDRLLALQERRKALAVLHNSEALIRVGARMLDYFQGEKNGRAVLDYEDQIMQTRNLLSAPDIAPWVLYKLDGGLDHILVDESQDTSPAQWSVIAALAEEFFAGYSAHEGERTIFAVGDEKQSIFSFQGADPVVLAEMRADFRRRVEDARRAWREVPLERSFRSTAAVLSAVDAVFARAQAAEGVIRSGETTHHEVARVGEGGLVELWPACVPRADEEEAPWAPPVKRRAGDNPEQRLARTIADKIAGWLRSTAAPGEDGWLAPENRPIRAGDIMVLVRTRGKFVPALVRALKARGVEVAGVDRMVLTEELAVMDLMALGDFLLLPDDDLTLAALLKGPFIGFSEEQLFALAWQRGKASLWHTLVKRRDENADFTRAHGILSALLREADFTPPFEFYGRFLGAGGGRSALLARLGSEAADPIDEFLSAALSYERSHPPSLQGFLHWLRAAQSQLKRDPEQARDEVRVMTVHGAKGLQAPIVFLPDTMSMPRDRRTILWAESEDILSSAVPLWPGRRAGEDKVSKALRAKAWQQDMDEYRRLLYVAMTRAEDRLYICAWHGVKKPSEDCWNQLIRDGLAELVGAVETPFDFADGDGWSGEGVQFICPQTVAPPETARMAVSPDKIGELPSYFRQIAPPEPRPPRPLAPSRRFDTPPPLEGQLQEAGESAFLRGRLIHRLLELLPEQEPEARAEAAQRFLARPAYGLTEARCTSLAAEVLSVLNDAAAAPLFGPNSQAEVPLAAVIGKHVVAGQVDRLLVEEDCVSVVDFKSRRAAPPGELTGNLNGDSAGDSTMPMPYLAQMADYRAVLRAIFPDREIRCALLFTDGPALVWLADSALDSYAP